MNINKVCAAWRLVKQLSLLRAAGAAGCNRSSNDPIPIFQTPASDRLRLSSLFGGTILAPQDAIDHAAKYPIGKYGENRAYNQRFERIDPALDDDLVDHVDNDRQNVDPANVLPGFKQQGSPVCRIFQNRPEIQRSACSGVRPPGADSIEKGDERLKNQAEPKWRMHAARYVAPCAYEGVKQVVKHHFSADGPDISAFMIRRYRLSEKYFVSAIADPQGSDACAARSILIGPLLSVSYGGERSGGI